VTSSIRLATLFSVAGHALQLKFTSCRYQGDAHSLYISGGIFNDGFFPFSFRVMKETLSVQRPSQDYFFAICPAQRIIKCRAQCDPSFGLLIFQVVIINSLPGSSNHEALCRFSKLAKGRNFAALISRYTFR